MLLYVLVFTVALFGLSSTREFTLPVNTCKRDSTDYSTCLKQALQEVWPLFVEGLPEYDVPPLDPFFYNYGKFEFDKGDIYAKIILSNVTLSGLSKLRLNDVRPHFLDEIFRVEIDVQIPRIFIEGIVDVDGSLYGLKIATEGFFNITANDATGSVDVTGPVVNDAWIVKKFQLLSSVKELKVYFHDFHESTKGLSGAAVAFINEFWPSLYRILMPVAVDQLTPLLANHSNNFFSKVPFSKIFP